MADKQRVYYHVTFQPYKRLHALYDEVEDLFLDMMPGIARQVGFNFIIGGVVPDHAHILVEKAPWDDLGDIVQAIQDITSERIFETFPDLAYDMGTDYFWTRGFHYERHTEATLETVKAYIADQKRHHGLA